MEINLNVVFSVVLAVLVINLILFFILKNRISNLESNSLEQQDGHSNSIKQSIEGLMQMMTTSFAESHSQNAEKSEKVKVQLQESLIKLQEQIEFRATQQQESLNKLQKQTELQATQQQESLTQLQKQTELQAMQQQESLTELQKQTELQATQQQESLTELQKQTELQATQQQGSLTKLQEQTELHATQQQTSILSTTKAINKLANEHSENSRVLEESIKLGLSKSIQQVQSSEESLESLIETKLDDVKSLTNKGIFSSNQQQLSNFEKLIKQVQMLRIENIVELTNSLGKHKELQVDSGEFVKYLGDCKVLKIEDKLTGQFTQIYYEDGIKRSADTFSGEELKYQMFFDENGKAERGVELNEKGGIAFEYYYDQAGEVNKCVEFIYDESDREVRKKEMKY